MATVNVTTPVDTGIDIQVIANDGTTEIGITEIDGVVYVVTRAVRRFGEWHGSPLLPGVTIAFGDDGPAETEAAPDPDPAVTLAPV